MSKKNDVIELKSCRICGGEKLTEILSLGSIPPANSFLRKRQLKKPERRYPVEVCFCDTCKLMQLRHVVDPGILFNEYLYVTSASEPLKTHFSSLASTALKKFSIPKGDLVVDIGSNDGTLLASFKKLQMAVLGIEPAANLAQLSCSQGILTENSFFSENIAKEIVQERGQAKIVTATNVFAHVHDVDDFLRGVLYLLDNDGVFIIEVPYLVDLVDKHEFDTMYHEHLSYFLLRSLITLFKRFNMAIIDVEQISTAGGSIRVYVNKGKTQSPKILHDLLEREEKRGFYSLKTYQIFAQEIEYIRGKLTGLLGLLKAQGARIAGYGAPAKATVLLNYCNIDTSILDYIVDTTSFKQGLYLPGVHIPIWPESRFHQMPPDYFLLLAWNFSDTILSKEKDYRNLGGRFIVPIPEPYIV